MEEAEQIEAEVRPIRAPDPYSSAVDHPLIALDLVKCEVLPAAFGWEPGRTLMICNCCRKDFFGSEEAVFCCKCVYETFPPDVEEICADLDRIRQQQQPAAA